jgi:hypothetical protein
VASKETTVKTVKPPTRPGKIAALIRDSTPSVPEPAKLAKSTSSQAIQTGPGDIEQPMEYDASMSIPLDTTIEPTDPNNRSIDMKRQVGEANQEIAETLKSLETTVFSKPKFDF